MGMPRESADLTKWHLVSNLLFSYQNIKNYGVGPNSGPISNCFVEWNLGRVLWNQRLDLKFIKNAFHSVFFLSAAQSLTNTLSHIEITPHITQLPAVLIHFDDSDGMAKIKFVTVI